MKDVSSYKVVFDDLDEKIIKRGSLCIKGEIKIVLGISKFKNICIGNLR